MTPEQIAAWAREADPEFGNDDGDMPDALCGIEAITRFAELVAEHVRAQITAPQPAAPQAQQA